MPHKGQHLVLGWRCAVGAGGPSKVQLPTVGVRRPHTAAARLPDDAAGRLHRWAPGWVVGFNGGWEVEGMAEVLLDESAAGPQATCAVVPQVSGWVRTGAAQAPTARILQLRTRTASL